jgi:hypothetical protein
VFNFDVAKLYFPEIVFPGEEVNLLLKINPLPLKRDFELYD